MNMKKIKSSGNTCKNPDQKVFKVGKNVANNLYMVRLFSKMHKKATQLPPVMQMDYCFSNIDIFRFPLK